MDFAKGLRVSSSALTANRLRMNTISSNIANVKYNTYARGWALQKERGDL